MSTYAPSAAQVTDTVPTLWYKVAAAFQAYHPVADDGTLRTSPAQIDDDQAVNLLRAAYAAQQSIP